ncbi:MAG TPA: hypothetical protein VMJ10_02135 [Kofleriaceae bacterium]|nr:hypothetical protein [Kofleriaceae bacterium]
MTELRVVAASLAESALAQLAPAARCATLEDVLAWVHAQRPPGELVDVVVQDEFTHDVIVRAPGVIAAYLVFDTT